MPTTTNYDWTTPTVGGDENTWGDELNEAIEDIDGDLKLVENKADAAQAAADALDTRVDGLEADAPGGLANWRAGQWYYGATCQGPSTDIAVTTSARRYLIPFLHQGRFSGFGFIHSGPSVNYTLYVLDSQESGVPGTELWSGNITVVHASTVQDVVISPTITITRPAWLGIKATGAGQLQMRGYGTGGPSGTPLPQYNWLLGVNTLNVTTYTEVPSVIYGDSAPYTPTVLGGYSEGWAPVLALKSA